MDVSMSMRLCFLGIGRWSGAVECDQWGKDHRRDHHVHGRRAGYRRYPGADADCYRVGGDGRRTDGSPGRSRRTAAFAYADTVESGKAVRTVQDEALATYALCSRSLMVNWIFPAGTKIARPDSRRVSLAVRIQLFGRKADKSTQIGAAAGYIRGIGVIQEGKRLIVGCGEGLAGALEVQPEGGKRMSGQDFLRGAALARRKNLHPAHQNDIIGRYDKRKSTFGGE